jgi:hypothetical protein
VEPVDTNFEKLITQSSAFSPDFLRFCLSDMLPINITQVVDGAMDPVTYAGRVEKKKADDIIMRFFPGNAPSNKYPHELERAWAYDKLVNTAAYYRISKLFPNSPKVQRDLFTACSIYLLNVYDKNVPISALGGLSHFTAYITSIMKMSPEHFRTSESIYLRQLLNAVSTSDHVNWLMWDTKWHGILNYEKRANALRRFFHASFSYFPMDEENFSDAFKLTGADILDLMSEFIDLRRDPNVPQSDVSTFIKRLPLHFELEPQHPGYSFALEAPYELAQIYFIQCQGDTSQFHQHMRQQANA